MRFMVLVEEKPEKCEECYFYNETLVQIDNDKFNVERKCSLSEGTFENCPLTEIKAIFDSKEGEE